MAQTQAYLRAWRRLVRIPANSWPAPIASSRLSDSGHFVTMFLGRLDVVTRSFVYVGAGHQAYLIANDGAVRVLHSTSIPLGVERDHSHLLNISDQPWKRVTSSLCRPMALKKP